MEMGDNYIHELCRLCLYKSANLFDIFLVNGRHGYLAAEVIRDLLQVEVALSDGFPRCVCSVCLDKLTDFKLFKDQCLELRSAFEQEFHSKIESTKRQGSAFRVNQDPLVCSSSIKVEVKSEAEIVEIPVETDEEEVFEEQVYSSPLRSEVSELDVVTIDDDDNVLCLGSKEELGMPPLAVARRGKLSSPDKQTPVDARQFYSKRDQLGRFLKKKASKGSGRTTLGEEKSSGSRTSSKGSENKSGEEQSASMKSLTLSDLLTSAPRPGDVKATVEEVAQGAEGAGHPLWLDSDEGESTTQGSREQTKDCGTRRGMSKRRRQSSSPRSSRLVDKAVKGSSGDFIDGSRSKSEKRIRAIRQERNDVFSHGKSPDPPQEMRNANPQNRHREVAVVDPIAGKRFAGDAAQGDSTGPVPKMQYVDDAKQHPLFDGDDKESSEPHWKHHHRRAAQSAPMYTEGSILLSSGNTPQGFVDVDCLGSEIKRKKRKRRRVSMPGGAVAAATAQGGDDTTTMPNPQTVDHVTKSGTAPEKGKKVYKCSICSVTFKSWPSYKKHRRTQHSKAKGKQEAYCPHCNRSFSCLQSMKRHELLHLGLRPFACNLCNNGYTRIDHLKRHMEAHHKQLTAPGPISWATDERQ